MAYLRSQLVSDEDPGFFHCVRQCVRRAILCGFDHASGQALGRSSQGQARKPVVGLDADALSDMTESSYMELVRWTGLQAHPEKRSKLSATEKAASDGLWSIAKHTREWMRYVLGFLRPRPPNHPFPEDHLGPSASRVAGGDTVPGPEIVGG